MAQMKISKNLDIKKSGSIIYSYYTPFSIYRTNNNLAERLYRKDDEMPTNEPYYKILARENSEKLNDLLETLPAFCRTYFRGISEHTSVKTRISYAYDLRTFFRYAIDHVKEFSQYKNLEDNSYLLEEMTVEDLSKISSELIEFYLYDLDEDHAASSDIQTNGKPALARKLFAIRGLYNYFYKKKEISENPTLIIKPPKIDDKPIIYLEANQVATLLEKLNNLENELMDGQQKTYFLKNKLRDIAIITLLLGTGIRVSECVGIDLNQIDFNENILLIHRKGGDDQEIDFNNEVKEALHNYITQVRNHIIPESDSTTALFLSSQKKRISVDAVEDLVKKYTKMIFPTKKITPHKLRSSFASNLYAATGDIALVGEFLGHKSIEMTKKRYASSNRAKKISAINDFRLNKE